MTTRDKISLNSTVADIVAIMSEGIPGSINVMMGMIDTYGVERGVLDILRLDDMNIRGTQIWVGFKDHCESDMQIFVGCVRNRDQEMIDKINEECLQPGHFVEHAVKDRYAT